MADKKISALTGAATPLAGTEVLPIVQSGATVKVAVNDLTAGKTVNGSNFIASSSFGAGGTTPTAGWSTAVFQTQNASFNSNNGQDLRLYQNIYYDGSNYRYITANPGGFMLQYQNETEWFRSTDGSPAAGGVASATSVVKFTTTGNVNVSNGDLVFGAAGKGITTTVANGDVTVTPLGTGKTILAKNGLKIPNNAAITVGTSATQISVNAISWSSLAFVFGVDGGGNAFSDLVFYADGTTVALASRTVNGVPVTRTYTAPAGQLNLAMLSGSYSVFFQHIWLA